MAINKKSAKKIKTVVKGLQKAALAKLAKEQLRKQNA